MAACWILVCCNCLCSLLLQRRCFLYRNQSGCFFRGAVHQDLGGVGRSSGFVAFKKYLRNSRKEEGPTGTEEAPGKALSLATQDRYGNNNAWNKATKRKEVNNLPEKYSTGQICLANDMQRNRALPKRGPTLATTTMWAKEECVPQTRPNGSHIDNAGKGTTQLSS